MGGEDGQTTAEPQAQGMYAGPSWGLGLTGRSPLVGEGGPREPPRRNQARPSMAAGTLLTPQNTQGSQ